MYLNVSAEKFAMRRIFSATMLRTMKLTVLLIAFACMQAVASSYAQGIKLSENNTRLGKVFEKIEKQTNYRFFYKGTAINNIRVTANVDNASIDQVLSLLLKNQPFTYNLVDQTIIIHPVEPAKEKQVYVAEITVKGKVTDNNNEPLPGVTVRVRGANRGVITDAAGNYEIRVDEATVLEFTSIGFKSIAESVKGRTQINIAMQPESQTMTELVVVGYGTVQKRDLTGAVSSLSAKEFTDKPITRIDQMLQGKAAGVDVKSTDGAPGSGATIRIRGSRSINADNEPLYVIDGLISGANLNTINPEDVESIDILKDASAAAIYGSRAANGVIIVTTKKGKAGQNVSSLKVIAGFQELPRRPDLMNAREFAEFINESRLDLNRPVLYPDIDAAVAAVGGDKGTSWIDALTRRGGYKTYNLSTSGGEKKLTYFLSGNVLAVDGIVKNTDLNRYQGRANLNKTFSDKVNLGLVFNASRYTVNDGSSINFGSNSGWIGSMLTMPPTMRVRRPDGSLESYNPIYYTGGDMDSAVATAELTENTNTVNDLQSNLFLEVQPVKGLRIKSSFGTSLSTNRRNTFIPTYMPSKVATNAMLASASAQSGTSILIQNENTATYDRRFNQHHLNVLGGFTYERRENSSMQITASGLTDDIMKYNNLGATPQANRGTTSSAGDNTRLSYLGRINYDFAGRYYLTVTGRYDGASNFAANHKWGFFPSFGAKWRASDEQFFKNLHINKTLSNLAFRVSYGKSGNQGIGNYQSLAAVAPNSSAYIFGGNQVLGYTQSLLANNNLTWETTRQLDIGTDVEFFNGRLTVDANYYSTRTSNLLLNVQIPTQTGFGSRLMNIGRTKSSGFELLVSGDIIRKNKFTWNATLTASTNEQTIVDLGPLVKQVSGSNGYGANTNFMEVGVPLGANYGVDYMGVWHNQAEIDAELAKPAGQRTLVSPSGAYRPGKPKYGDYNGDGVLNVNDYQYKGTQNPKLFGGLGNTFTYKNVSLNFFFQYVSGNTMYNDIEFFMGAGSELTNQFAYMVDRWKPTNPNSDIPGVNSRDNVASTRFLHDASFIRLRTLQLNYSIKRVLPKVFRQIDLFVTGSNLLLFTKYNGFDPEVNKEGGSSTIRAKDDGTYPNARTIAIGLNVGF